MAISFSLGLEIPELADLQIQADGSEGDFPAVQLANNDGTPAIKVPLSGYSDADADVPGDIRIGDFDYLSNGNIVIVSESRQKTDLVDRFGGALPGQNITFRIVKPDGTVVDFEAKHTFSPEQVEWFKAGSALNIVRAKVAAGK